jgi:predicted NUDIX family NTP pyrophosphohydrolase
MPTSSAGILLYREPAAPEVFIGHMGGPFWAKKDAGAWSIPKGIVDPGEGLLAAALREFAEETGSPAPRVDYEPLGDFRYSSGKVVTVFAGLSAAPIDFAPQPTVTVEWPPRSGRSLSFAELDRVAWVPLDAARDLLVKGQRPALDALAALLA